jgi:hypothetical protein
MCEHSEHTVLRKLAILVVVAAGIAVIVIGAAAFIRARNTSASNACINNLRQLDSAKEQWATENQKTTNERPTWDAILPYLARTNACPQGGKYTLGRVGDSATCSIGGPSHSQE